MEIAADIIWGIIAALIVAGVLAATFISIRNGRRNKRREVSKNIERIREIYENMGYEDLDIHIKLLDRFGEKNMPKKSIPMSTALVRKMKMLEERIDALEKNSRE